MPVSTPTSLELRYDIAASTAVATSGAVTFTTGRLYLAFLGGRFGAQSWDPAVDGDGTFAHGGTDRSGSWTRIDYAGCEGAPPFRVMSAYWYLAGATENVVFTWTQPKAAGNNMYLGLVEVASGFDSGAPIAQGNVDATNTDADNFTVSLAAPPAASSLLLSWFHYRGTTTGMEHRTNWTELAEHRPGGATSDSGGLEMQYTFTTEQDASCSTLDADIQDWIGGIIEVQEGAGGGPGPQATRSIMPTHIHAWL